MKSRTECRYWTEFYHYEQWLIDNDYVSSRDCYSMTKRICDEYLTGLSEYVQLMKKYKENTVRVKVSRLALFLKSVLNMKQHEQLREAYSLIRSEISSVSSQHIRIMKLNQNR